MISVIIPTYNRENTIIRSVQSVLDQTIFDLEVIIVDDCSTDNTESKLNEIKDKRIRYVKLTENKGANYARNKGISLAKGEYIAFQDSDDYWYEEKLEKQITFLKKNSSDVVFCKMKSYDGADKVQLVPEGIAEGEITVDELLYSNLISTQVILGKKECFLEESFDITFPRYQDWDLVIRLAHKYKLVFQDEVLVDRFTQNDSISKNPAKALASFEMILNKYNYLYKRNPKALFCIYNLQAVNAVLSDQKPDPYLNKMLNLNFSFKTLSKWILNKLNIYPLIIKSRSWNGS